MQAHGLPKQRTRKDTKKRSDLSESSKLVPNRQNTVDDSSLGEIRGRITIVKATKGTTTLKRKGRSIPSSLAKNGNGSFAIVTLNYDAKSTSYSITPRLEGGE